MKPLSPFDQIAFAELLDLCRDPLPPGADAPNGSFVKQKRNGDQEYWYYRGYEKTLDGTPGKSTLIYIGKVGDPEVEGRVAAQVPRHADHKKRRSLAAHLRRVGLPSPQPMEGAIASVLAREGVFSKGSVMVGSIAFQTFGGLLSARFDGANLRTQDVDIAQPARITLRPGTPPIDLLEALRAVDPTFTPIFIPDEPRLVAGYRNKDAFKVEFLTPQRSERGSASRLTEVVGLKGVGAARLKYLEFVLANPSVSVMLHDAGIAVTVPDPMRYAIHKLIVSVQRTSPDSPGGSNVKAIKDIRQAGELVEAAGVAHMGGHLGSLWVEAWNMGPKWRKSLAAGTLKLNPAHLDVLAGWAAEAASVDGSPCPFGRTGAQEALIASPISDGKGSPAGPPRGRGPTRRGGFGMA